jgi:membrane-associated protein
MGGARPVSRLLDFLSGLHPVLLCAATSLFMCVETSLFIGLLIPGDAVVLLAGSAADSLGRIVLVIVAASAGCLAGESLGYLLGRRFGPSIQNGRLGRRIGSANWARAESYLRRRGGPAVFGSRFVTVIHALVPVVAGTLSMPYRRFISWAAPAAVVWSCLYAGVGMALGASYREYGAGLGPWGTLVPPAIVCCVVAFRLLRRRLARARASRA